MAARLRTFDKAKAISKEALDDRQERLNEIRLADRITREDYDKECRLIDAQRSHLTAPPAPLFAQQQQVLRTLAEQWDGLTSDDRKRMLAAIFDSISATADGVDRLEPCEDWRPYIIAAISRPVRVPTERKTGLYVPNVETARLLRDERGWLRMAS